MGEAGKTEVLRWKEISRETVAEEHKKKLERVTFLLPNHLEKKFLIHSEQKVCAVLAITKDYQVILVKQFRPGPDDILLDLPGGFIEDDEFPEQAATRELREETGYEGNTTFVVSCFDDPYSRLTRYCFAATGCERVTEPSPDGGELLQVVLTPMNQFRGLLRSGKMTDIEAGYLALDFLDFL